MRTVFGVLALLNLAGAIRQGLQGDYPWMAVCLALAFATAGWCAALKVSAASAVVDEILNEEASRNDH